MLILALPIILVLVVDPDQISKYLLGESKNGWSWTYGWCALLFRKVQYYGRLPLEILVTFPEVKDGGKICFQKIYVGGEGQGFCKILSHHRLPPFLVDTL